jgi:hypothetical protein
VAERVDEPRAILDVVLAQLGAPAHLVEERIAPPDHQYSAHGALSSIRT